MRKKLFVLLFSLAILLTGCSGNLSRSDMLDKNYELLAKINELERQNDEFNKTKSIIEFYNKVSNESMNSLVLVESKNKFTSATKYSNGVIIGNAGLQFYVLVDYSAIEQRNMNITVMDSYADSHAVTRCVVDEESGLALLTFSLSINTSQISAISLGGHTDIVAYLDSMEQKQLNKVVILENIKSSTIEYNNTTYASYIIEDFTVNSGSILINMNNKLLAIYSSKLSGFVNYSLIRDIVDLAI